MAKNYQDVEAAYELVQRRIPLDYIWTPELMRTALARSDRLPRVLWLTAPTGIPHFGYMIPFLKLADFVLAGCEVVVVLLDTYSFLDNVHFPMEQVLERAKVYESTVRAALKSFGVDSDRVKYVHESSYDKSLPYIRDQWKVCTLVSQKDVAETWDRAVLPHMLSPMLPPVLQTLSEEYTDCDIHFGGDDQASLFRLADRCLPKMGYRTRPHMMNAMLPNLVSEHGKMSSSHPAATKLTYIEEDASIRRKIQGAWNIDPASRDKCGPLRILHDILLPLSQLQRERAADSAKYEAMGIRDAKLRAPFWTPTDPKQGLFTVTHGAQLWSFQKYDDILSSLDTGVFPEECLLDAVCDAVGQIISATRESYKGNAAWQEAHAKSYPGEVEGACGH